MNNPDRYPPAPKEPALDNEPRTIECNVCGHEVILWSGWANECDECGTEYNGFGQQLAPRSQWGDVGEDYYGEDY